MHFFVLPFLLTWPAVACLHAQTQFPAPTPLRGRIDGPSPHRLKIVLVPSGAQSAVAQTNPDRDGSFELDTSSIGAHHLRIYGPGNQLLHTEALTLPFLSTLRIELDRQSEPASYAPPVSLSRLQHKVPRKAYHEFKAASNATRAKAIEHLSQAVEIDPLYFEAINNLGVQYLLEERFEDAASAFERAAAIDPSDPIAEANFALVLLRLNRFAEAEQAARASLRADSLSGHARFYLALSLLQQNKPTKEVLSHPERATRLEAARDLLDEIKRTNASLR